MAALEARVNELAADARAAREDAAARHLAAARDRDIADLAVKVDANRSAINALGEQTRERFDAVDRRFDALERKVDDGFIEIRGKFDATAAGLDQITGLLNTLISSQQREPAFSAPFQGLLLRSTGLWWTYSVTTPTDPMCYTTWE